MARGRARRLRRRSSRSMRWSRLDPRTRQADRLMVEAIFWDNDGVLVDTEHLYFEATRRVLASVDIPLTEEDYRELFLVQGRGAWHLAEARDVQALKQQRNALY